MKIIAWIFILFGLFGIADIVYKIMHNNAGAIHVGNINGVGLLIVGITLLVKNNGVSYH
jgi:hypothetical protein